jgi:hypothetical protein
VVIGEESCCGCRPHEQGGVEAGPGEIAQPFYQLWQKGIRRDTGNLCGEQSPPLRVCIDIRRNELLVELLLPG